MKASGSDDSEGVYTKTENVDKRKTMETKLPLHVSQLKQPQTTINRIHTVFHFTALLALLYYRFSSPFYHQHITDGFLPSFSWFLISFSELVHSFIWILGQPSRWRPISRDVYPERLPEDKQLPPIDVFICTADPNKEPTIGVMNTLISAMCLDYPPEKLFVYVSDDGGAPITLFGMKEAYSFAKQWIPFCIKYGIKTRAPDAYFSQSHHQEENGLLSNNKFVESRKEMKVRYQVFKQRVEKARVNGTLSSGRGRADRPPIIQVIQNDAVDDEVKENETKVPLLVYVSREKRPTHPHHFKAGALNVLLRVSGIISNSPYVLALDCDMYCNDPTSARQAMCFHIDPNLSRSLAFVQFPQMFHNLSKSDIYNDLLRTAFEVQWYGMDGLRGPFLSGTGFYLKREALFRSPTQKDLSHITNKQDVGCSDEFIASLHRDNKFEAISNNQHVSNRLLDEARLLASCTYDQHTQWGEQIGFMYHSVVEDYMTGFQLFCKGWISVYRNSPRPAFLGSATTNLNDTLVQTTRWNSGLLQCGFSRFCPLTYGSSRMSVLQSMVFSAFAFQSLSALPMLCYAFIPQLCLLNGIPLYPKVSNPWFVMFAVVYTSWQFQRIYEVLSTGGSLRLWWNHERILLIKSVTAYFIPCLDVIMKFIGTKEINFVPTNKVVDDEQVERYNRNEFDFQAATRLLLPLTTIVTLNIASFILGLRRVLLQKTYDDLFGQIFLSLFIVILNYPIIEGMILRKDKGRIPLHVTILSGAFFIITGRAPPPPPLTSSTPPPPPETVKRKRGRPRKYGTPETPQTAASSAAKKLSTTTNTSPSVTLPSSPPRKKDPSSVSSISSSKKYQLSALGNAGQNFVPHIITVNAGEDVSQKIMSFTQQRKRAVCILSASGSISNASLRQPATLGGNVTYEGRFEILSLSGSFLHTETEGGSSRTGGLSVCLSGTDGRIIGGGVGGPLKAAGPVQVIIGSFVVDTNKETSNDPKFETSSSKLPPQVIGATFSSVIYHSPDSSGRNSGRVNNDHQNVGVNNFMLQSRGMHSMPSQSSDWRDSPGLTDHGAYQSSEDGDDGNLQH
ncbi:Cellulose synthase-like protein g1 [Thalictrum thalictroides]|uniref:Cellulose synthase-like protein g1 n=1 Tax=Thalictrum thalictroides TaxID=46969 RepID=A0A7J6VKV9_THATH|nr:Cellulose synthase-like protein g1 [Thalictrum thalictroides]